MRRSLTLVEFASLTRTDANDIERYRSLGLLDPDGDGLFDDYDTLRLQFVLVSIEGGTSVDALVRALDDGTLNMPFFGDLLFDFRGGSLSLEAASEKLGLTVEQIRALATAIGMPITRAFDEKDLAAMNGAQMALAAGLPWQAVIEASRVFGDSFRRIAGTESRLVNEYIVTRDAVADPIERTKRAYDALELLAPVIEPLLGFIHKQYLLRAFVEDALKDLEPDRDKSEAAILFVDLSSFTRLASVHGDERAAEVLERFEDMVRTLVIAHQGALVKQIGDEFMLTFDRPEDAVRFAIDLGNQAAQESEFPALRVGIYAGPVLYRVGDYVGTTVNIASRITSAAAPNEIVVGESVAKAAEAAGIQTEPVGTRLLRGVEAPVSLFRIVRARSGERDPVCGMTVAGTRAARLQWDGREHAFCSQECLKKFVDDPARYATA